MFSNSNPLVRCSTSRMFIKLLPLALIYLIVLNNQAKCDDSENFPMRASKNTHRITKRSNKNNSNDDFEKFFLKASKSVPRIGRRGPPVKYVVDNYVGNNEPYHYTHPQQQTDEFRKLKYPVWSEIAERFEYDPDLFSSPALLNQLEQVMGDDPTVYDWDKVRLEPTSS